MFAETRPLIAWRAFHLICRTYLPACMHLYRPRRCAGIFQHGFLLKRLKPRQGIARIRIQQPFGVAPQHINPMAKVTPQA
jgi:hypothetical protein